MINWFLQVVSRYIPQEIVYAHCDIPCGIYDPHQAQLGAHTIIRMTQLIQDLKKEDLHTLIRLTRVKEEHAELVKHEICVLWGDYFKEEHVKEYPDLHSLIFTTLKLASKAKQHVDMKAAEELLASVQKIAEIFYKTKGVTPIRVKSLYPSGGELVSYQ